MDFMLPAEIATSGRSYRKQRHLHDRIKFLILIGNEWIGEKLLVS